MAAFEETIAKCGVMVAPHLGVAASKVGKVVENLDSHSSRRVISTQVATEIRDMMVAVVTNGQADVGISGIEVAGKTGTAETGVDGNSHAWFLAFAPAQDPVIAVAVIVENGGHGGSVAAPIAGQVIQAAVGQ